VPSAPVFPSARADRGVPSSFSPLPQVAGLSAPRTRVIAFRIANPAANSRETLSVGPFVGPAIFQRAQWWCDNANATAVHALGFGTSLAPITESSVPFTTLKGWEDLIERADKDVYATDAKTIGFWQPNTTPTLAGFRGDLRHIIQKPQFYITITAYGSPGAGNRWTGDLTVIENVSQQALANFL
jgi:hypothetical protein